MGIRGKTLGKPRGNLDFFMKITGNLLNLGLALNQNFVKIKIFQKVGAKKLKDEQNLL